MWLDFYSDSPTCFAFLKKWLCATNKCFDLNFNWVLLKISHEYLYFKNVIWRIWLVYSYVVGYHLI